MGKSAVGAGEIWLVGNETTPGNVVITTSVSTGSGQGILYFNALKSVYRIRGLTLQASSGTNNGIAAAGGSLVYAQNIKFGTGLGDHLRVGSEAVITPEGNYEIAGSAVRHMNSGGSGLINLASGSLTITLTGTPAFSNSFAFVQTCGGIYVSGATFAGSATGPRYVVSLNGVINTFGGGANVFPGNSAGSIATGGQYV